MNLKKFKSTVGKVLDKVESFLSMKVPTALAVTLIAGAVLAVGYNAYTKMPLSPNASTDLSVTTITPTIASNNGDGGKASQRIAIPAERSIVLSGEVGDQSRDVAQKIASLAQASADPIYLLINSPGGSVLDGILIIQAIEASKAPVVTICTQMCASMAAMIFEYGATRYLGNKAFLMFHPASAGAQGELDKIVSRLSFFQNLIGGLEGQIAQRAGLSFSEYKVKSGSELWLTGNDAVTQRFADAVVLIEGDAVFSQDMSVSGADNSRRNKSTQKVDVTW